MIIKLLEERGIEKGQNPAHIEAAFLSYQNNIFEEIYDEINDGIYNYLTIGLISSLCSK